MLDRTAIVLNRNEDGFGRLVLVDLADRSQVDVSRGWHAGLEVARRQKAEMPPVTLTPK